MTDKNRDKPLHHARRPPGQPRKLGGDSPLPGSSAIQRTSTGFHPALEGFLRELGEMAAEAVLARYRQELPPSGKPTAEYREQEPRLLGVKAAAAYLGLSPWTLRELPIPRVRLELPNGKEQRKVLYDRRDLDRWIERHKE